MRTVSIGGFRFAVENTHPSYWNQVDRGDWETETFRVLDRYIGADTSVIDMGAWIGTITLYASKLALNVIAIEPDPIAFAHLTSNLSLNPDVQT